MRLSRLHEMISALIDQGHGAARVIDENGNSVVDVSAPERPSADDGDDTSAVMLHARIEYGERRSWSWRPGSTGSEGRRRRAMTDDDQPDEVTVLIARALARGHAAPKATPEQLASRTADFLPLAGQVRDALSAEGWLNDGEEQVTARRILDMEHIRRSLRDEVARMVALECEKHRADGRAEAHRLWMEGKGNA